MKLDEIIKRLASAGWEFVRFDSNGHRLFQRGDQVRTLAYSRKSIKGDFGRAQLHQIAARFEVDPTLFDNNAPRKPRALGASALKGLADVISGPAPTDSLGVQILAYMKAKHYTVNTLASRLGVPVATVKGWIQGLHTPNVAQRAKLAEEFGWTARHQVEGEVTVGPRAEVEVSDLAVAASRALDQAERELSVASAPDPVPIQDPAPAIMRKELEIEGSARRAHGHIDVLVAEIVRLTHEVESLNKQLAARQAPPEDEAVAAYVAIDDLRRFLG